MSLHSFGANAAGGQVQIIAVAISNGPVDGGSQATPTGGSMQPGTGASGNRPNDQIGSNARNNPAEEIVRDLLEAVAEAVEHIEQQSRRSPQDEVENMLDDLLPALEKLCERSNRGGSPSGGCNRVNDDGGQNGGGSDCGNDESGINRDGEGACSDDSGIDRNGGGGGRDGGSERCDDASGRSDANRGGGWKTEPSRGGDDRACNTDSGAKPVDSRSGNECADSGKTQATGTSGAQPAGATGNCADLTGTDVEKWKNPAACGAESTSGLRGMIPASSLDCKAPIPKNGGAKKETPSDGSDLMPPTCAAPNEVAKSGPLKGIPNGEALAAAAKKEGVDPYLLAGVATVETGDNANNRVVNDATRKDGLCQVNSGVWHSPENPGQNAQMAARLIKMYTKEAGGDVARGLNAYNTGSVDQAGYAAKGNHGERYGSYSAGVANAINNIKAYQKTLG